MFLPNLEGKLELVMDNKHTTAVVFLSPECPLCQNYTLTLNNMIKKYWNNNVKIIGIFPGTFFSKADFLDFKKKYKVSFPLYTDASNMLTKRLGATVTPEVFLIDSQGKIQYKGRIDNWAYEVSRKRKVITQHDLQNALESLIHHQPILVTQTKAIGCFIE